MGPINPFHSSQKSAQDPLATREASFVLPKDPEKPVLQSAMTVQYYAKFPDGQGKSSKNAFFWGGNFTEYQLPIKQSDCASLRSPTLHSTEGGENTRPSLFLSQWLADFAAQELPVESRDVGNARNDHCKTILLTDHAEWLLMRKV